MGQVCPVAAFEGLDHALMRGVAFLATLEQRPEAEAQIVPMMEQVITDVFEAYAALAIHSDGVTDIKAFLIATYGEAG